MKRREAKFVHESPRLSPAGIAATPVTSREVPRRARKGYVPPRRKRGLTAGHREGD